MKLILPLTLLALVMLSGCAGLSDVLTPDQLVLGTGQSHLTGDLDPSGVAHPYGFDGDAESYSAALVWDLPSFGETRMDRVADSLERLVRDERATLGDGFLGLPGEVAPTEVREPPTWLPFVLGGAMVAVLLAFFLYSRRQSRVL